MAELVDALVSGTSDSNIVEVQVLSRAPYEGHWNPQANRLGDSVVFPPFLPLGRPKCLRDIGWTPRERRAAAARTRGSPGKDRNLGLATQRALEPRRVRVDLLDAEARKRFGGRSNSRVVGSLILLTISDA